LSLDLTLPILPSTVNEMSNNEMPDTRISTTPSAKPPLIPNVSSPSSSSVANSIQFKSRYSEFKTYSSTFDGLQALESHHDAQNITSNISVNQVPQPVNLFSDSQLIRVASLPAIAPQATMPGI